MNIMAMGSQSMPRLLIAGACLGLSSAALAGKAPVVPLTEQGEVLQRKYNSMLEELKKEIAAKLPDLDQKTATAFLGFRAVLNGL